MHPISNSMICCNNDTAGLGNETGPPRASPVAEWIDMNTVMAEELRSISGPEREQAYEELHGVFTGSGFSNFEETPELMETSLSLLYIELDRMPARRKRAYTRAIFLKPSLACDSSFAIMFLRADRFVVPAAAHRICRFFEEKLRLFGEAKLVATITLDDLSNDDISSVFSGAGHLLPQKDRSGRLVFFADYFFLDYKDWTNVNRMCWYLALAAVEDDEEVQKNGLVEVLIANDTLTKQKSITEHLSQGFAGLLCLPIRFVGIHFCYDNVIFHPILKLAQMVFGAGNRLRFRVHNGSPLEIQYALRSYGIILPIELFNRDLTFKNRLNDSFLAAKRLIESRSCSIENQGMVLFPLPSDVLLGKGRSCQEFSGNVAMNRQIDCRVEEYLTLDRSAKSVLAMQIATKILKDKEGGRFLERVQNVGWKIVQDKTIIRNKITQAFRARSRSVSFGETDEVEHEREREVDGHQKTFNEKNRNNEEETESDSKKARLET